MTHTPQNADEAAADEYAGGHGTTDCPEIFLRDAFLAGIAHEKEKSKGLVQALEAVVAAKCYDSCAHPQSVWWKIWVQDPARAALLKYRGGK
jgi:hypothetical protein